ncbi:MAG: hypothetical protein WAX80_03265 [Minisyncoccia bacterium]
MFGRSKARRRQVGLTDEVRLAVQEEREDTEELNLFWDYEGPDGGGDDWAERESLDSPFAVRTNPSHEDLEWFM